MKIISENDWKIFRSKLPLWQESYMDSLIKEYIYITLLNNKNKDASIKFWELEKNVLIMIRTI